MNAKNENYFIKHYNPIMLTLQFHRKKKKKHSYATNLQYLLYVDYQHSGTSIRCMSAYQTFTQMLRMSHSAPIYNLTKLTSTTTLFKWFQYVVNHLTSSLNILSIMHVMRNVCAFHDIWLHFLSSWGNFSSSLWTRSGCMCCGNTVQKYGLFSKCK